MSRFRPRRLALAGVLATAVIAAVALPASGDQPPDNPTETTTKSPDPIRKTFTLVTGDQVIARTGPGGVLSTEVRPGPGRSGMLFRKIANGNQHLVIPADATRLLATQVVDPRLFDVALLGRLGLDDASAPSLPLLVQHTGQARTVRAALPAGTELKRELPLVDAVALRQDRKQANELWRTWTATSAAKRATGLASTVTKLWLDGGITPLLDRSTAQIGAPAAWQAGLTGKGVKVAVLDSGYDADHPDLKDRVVASKSFTEDGDTVDRIGHGTHVASTLAGTGAGSDGKYRGVAPDADLMVGKVCGFGQCELSAIIAGMEWAAAEGARVVNLSLGGRPTDGTDILSAALDELTARTGTLFVVAAGNFGADYSVGNPASADHALAVASVTKFDTLSTFSSRGPRVGNLAVKPDLAAPGDRIVAARAAGTLARYAVNDSYAQLSGTSMAAPHASGAATLLAQQHPDWKAAELKAGLINSAKSLAGIGIFGQGGGRVDLTRAIGQPIIAIPGSLDLGLQSYPHDDDKPVTKTVTYRNDSAEPVQLRLRISATGPDGRSSRIFRLSRSTVTVPARGTASVEVTADTSGPGPDGAYAGRLVATSKNLSIGTTVGVGKELPSFDRTFTMLDRTGQPAGTDDTRVASIAVIDRERNWVHFLEPGDKLRLPRGSYTVDGLLGTYNPNTQGYSEGLYFGEPEVVVDEPGELVLDGRRTTRVESRPPVTGAAPAVTSVGFAQPFRQNTIIAGIALINSFEPGYDPKLYVAQNNTGTARTFTGFGHATWAKMPPDQTPQHSFYLDSPYVYHDVAIWPGRFPAKPSLVTAPGDYAHLDASYAGEPGHRANNYAFPVLPRPDAGGHWYGAFLFAPAVEMSLPFRRQEYYSAKGVKWGFQTDMFRPLSGGVEVEYLHLVDSQHAAYPAGQTTPIRWQQAVFGPSLPDNRAGMPGRDPSPFVYRDGDALSVNVPLVSDGGPGRLGLSLVESEQTTLTRDGTEIGSTDAPELQTFQLPAEDGQYVLTKKVTRDTARFKLSTELTTAWTFRSRRTPDGEATALPLMTFRLQPDLDNRNQAPAGKFEVPFTVEHQYGAKALPVTEVTIEASFDGATWSPVPVRRTGQGWVATVDQPSGGAVSLRAKAVDAGGNEVVQTTQRAYLVR